MQQQPPKNHPQQLAFIKNKFMSPIYSPRTQYSNHLKELQQLKVSLIINIDKFILGNLKTEFQKKEKQLNQIEFLYFCNKHLKDWNQQLQGRSVKVNECLVSLWNDIDIEQSGKIKWEQFNSKIIEIGLNLKTLSNKSGVQAPSFKEYLSPVGQKKNQGPIAKMVYIKDQQKIAYFREEAIKVEFFSCDSNSKYQNFNTQADKSLNQGSSQNNSQSSSHSRPIFLPQRDLTVETMFKVKKKISQKSVIPPSSTPKPSHSRNISRDSPNPQSSPSRISKAVKKDVIVSRFKNTVLDMIYLDDKKYRMLLISCSDKLIRGYDVSSQTSSLAMQPENQDEVMIHQFPVEIHTMTWDSVNEVLFAAGKDPRIYQWQVKIDSQRELYDQRNGHQGMISSMLMMSKFQLLATGGFDGKMILWDTVSQTIRGRYEEHTRAISSIVFDQILILLFTASYDHKICVWNPYISTLIHKIDNNINILTLEIIPKTNFLLALDAGGNVKVRQMNRFTQVLSFNIFHSEKQSDDNDTPMINQPEKQSEIVMCFTSKNTLNYYFATDKIYHFRYMQVEKTSLDEAIINNFKYLKENYLLYIPMKNNFVLYNLLTGRINDILYDLNESEVTAFDFIGELGLLVIGGLAGDVSLRKIKNGMLIKDIYKFRHNVYLIKTDIVVQGQKESSVKKTYFIYCASQQGQIAIFKKQSKQQFELYKTLWLRKDFAMESDTTFADFDFLSNKSILIATNSQHEFMFIDFEKKTLLSKLKLNRSSRIISFSLYSEKSIMLSVTKKAELIGTFLPPSSKKYAISCILSLGNTKDIENSIIGSERCNRLYVTTKNRQLLCFKIDMSLLESYSEKIKTNVIVEPHWKVQIQDTIKKMDLIQDQQILILLSTEGVISYISAEDGSKICDMKCDKQTIKKYGNGNAPDPLLYISYQQNQVYLPLEDQFHSIDLNTTNEDEKIEIVINPNYYQQWVQQKSQKTYLKQSNPGWTLNLKYEETIEQKIKTLKQLNTKMIKNIPSSYSTSDIVSAEKRLIKAMQLQKKWQIEKQENDEDGRNVKFIKMHEESTINRGKSMGSLSQWHINKKNANKFIKNYNPFKRSGQSQKLRAKNKPTYYQSLHHEAIKEDPLYRLGNALISVNNSDLKASNFIKMAEKKQILKLPKLPSSKLQK